MSIKVRVDKDTEIDLVKAPHILIGGSTGSGKSYLMKSILCDILEKPENEDTDVIVIDPKSVDYQFLNNWRGIERCRFEGDTGESGRYADFYWAWKGIELVDRDGIDGNRVVKLLRLLCNEMDRRYQLMKKYSFSDWGEFVAYLDETKRLNDVEVEDSHGVCGYGEYEELEADGVYDKTHKRLVLMIDELTDLTYWDRDRDRGILRGYVEKYLVRLAMLGRAAGIHLILGTQRPDAQVLSGQLRANMPCRICLRVANKTERRIVLGMSGEGQEREMVYLSEYRPIGWDLR